MLFFYQLLNFHMQMDRMEKESDENGPVAQWIERRFPKPCVGGSNPLGAAMWIRLIRIGIPKSLDVTALAVFFYFGE